MSRSKNSLCNSLSIKSTGQAASMKAAVYLQTSDIPHASLAVKQWYVGDINHYQKRSCMRPYLLGFKSRTYRKLSEKCSKQASHVGEYRLKIQKESDFQNKSSSIRLFTGIRSYGINSALTYKWM